MTKLLEGVEAPKVGEISYEQVIDILNRKQLSIATLNYLKELLGKRSVIDMSGYSGNSTISIPADGKEQRGYCIKISEQLNQLRDEKILLSFFSRHGLTSKVVNYIQDNGDILITEQIPYELALSSLTTIEDLAEFMGRTLREFHDINWRQCDMTTEEFSLLQRNGERLITKALQHDVGLKFMGDYQKDHDYDGMKRYIKNHMDIYQADDVILHGDYNPRNVFQKENIFKGFVDVADSGFGDRHYDIFWTMWTISLYLGVQADPTKVLDCERIFLDSYGRDKIDPERLTLCKKLNCMYWQENNDITYFR